MKAKLKTIGKWTGIVLGGLILLSIVANLFVPDVVVVNDAGGTTTTIQEAAQETTTTATTNPTTTTQPAPPTTRSTTTTTSGEWSQSQWNEAAIIVLRSGSEFADWSDADILKAVRLVCDQAYEPAYSGGDDFILAVALSGDMEFGLRVSSVLGVLQVAPGCGNDYENKFADEAFRFLESFG